jgi:cellobiose-specific phosphotransferase system component IIA
MQQIPAEDQQLVLGVVGALQSADSTERSAVTSEIGSALAQRLVTGHETELATIENVTSGDATHISNLLLDDDAHLTDAVRLGTSLVEKIAGPDEAKKFEKIYGTVQQFQGLAVAFKLGTLSPASLLNGYVAAASILGALSGTSNSDNAPVLEALGKLSQQITEMRKEMDGRFDILEKGQQEILLKLDRVLQECVVNRVVMTDEIRNVENDLAALQARIDRQHSDDLLQRDNFDVLLDARVLPARKMTLI